MCKAPGNVDLQFMLVPKKKKKKKKKMCVFDTKIKFYGQGLFDQKRKDL